MRATPHSGLQTQAVPPSCATFSEVTGRGLHRVLQHVAHGLVLGLARRSGGETAVQVARENDVECFGLSLDRAGQVGRHRSLAPLTSSGARRVEHHDAYIASGATQRSQTLHEVDHRLRWCDRPGSSIARADSTRASDGSPRLPANRERHRRCPARTGRARVQQQLPDRPRRPGRRATPRRLDSRSFRVIPLAAGFFRLTAAPRRRRPSGTVGAPRQWRRRLRAVPTEGSVPRSDADLSLGGSQTPGQRSMHEESRR